MEIEGESVEDYSAAGLRVLRYISNHLIIFLQFFLFCVL